MSDNIQMILAVVLGALLLPVAYRIARLLTVEVEDDHVTLVLQFGKLVRTFREPGLHFFPGRFLPWTEVRPVSLQKDFRHIENVHVNDARGTTMLVDLWLEFRILDPERALFGVEDWEGSMRNLVSHAATSILGKREFMDILRNRDELSKVLQREVDAETDRWGIDVAFVFLRNISLLPDVSRQLFESVSARLERARAHIEEDGRIRVAKLEAETQAQVAAWVAEAKGQYPLAVGRALAHLKKRPPVFRAYTALYDLSQVRPHRTISFRGFGEREIRAVDAAMLQIGPAGGE
jgi:regulator of protease activity HflC (stomatin/prohibitin superfamily)